MFRLKNAVIFCNGITTLLRIVYDLAGKPEGKRNGRILLNRS
jgi:hypothetical protein